MPRSEGQQCHSRAPTPKSHLTPDDMPDLAPEEQPPGLALVIPKASYVVLNVSLGSHLNKTCIFNNPTFTGIQNK